LLSNILHLGANFYAATHPLLTPTLDFPDSVIKLPHDWQKSLQMKSPHSKLWGILSDTRFLFRSLSFRQLADIQASCKITLFTNLITLSKYIR